MNHNAAVVAMRDEILAEEDRRILEALDEAWSRGHKMSTIWHGTRKRVVEECTRCGLRVRVGRKRKNPLPECPVAIAEKIMEA